MKIKRSIVAVFGCLFLFLGCGDSAEKKQTDSGNSDGAKTQKATSEKKSQLVSKKFSAKTEPNGSTSNKLKSSKIVSKSFSSSKSDSSFSAARSVNANRSMNLAKAIIDYGIESQAANPTVVVWLFDVSKSATELRDKVISEIKTVAVPSAEKMFESVVATYNAGPIDVLTTSPVNDFEIIRSKMSEINAEPTDKEKTLTSLNECLNQFGPLRKSARKSVIMVLVTDESGFSARDEIQKTSPVLGDSLKTLKKYDVPLFVIGNPSPFGRSIDAVNAIAKDLSYGPETVFSERIKIGSWDGSTEADRYDSGYGPWELEKLCRDSGGRFLTNRPSSRSMRIVSRMQSNWPGTISRSFSDAAMTKYKPFYGSVDEYQADLKINKAKMAIHRAAKLPFTDVYRIQNYEFAAGNEAQLVRLINAAQRTPAVIRPGLEKLLELLKEGEKDRELLNSPRWKASFDLAYGRVLANYVRVVVLNTMLAELKGGKSFTNAENNSWVLEPNEEVTSGTGDKRLGEKASVYLNRVIKEHPDTPWARIATKELQSPFGWKWTEAKR